MNYIDIIEILDSLSYKGKKKFYRIYSIDSEDGELLELNVFINVKDRVTGKRDKVFKRYVLIPEEIKVLTKASLVRRVKEMLVYLETHEVEEQLLVNDERVFDPHSKELRGPNVHHEKIAQENKLSSFKQKIFKQLQEYREKQ